MTLHKEAQKIGSLDISKHKHNILISCEIKSMDDFNNIFNEIKTVYEERSENMEVPFKFSFVIPS